MKIKLGIYSIYNLPYDSFTDPDFDTLNFKLLYLKDSIDSYILPTWTTFDDKHNTISMTPKSISNLGDYVFNIFASDDYYGIVN